MDVPARMAVGEVVLTLVDFVEDYRQRRYPSMDPLPGSTAATEANALDNALASGWSREPVSLAFGMAEHHIRGAQDHLAGLGVLLLKSTVEDAAMTVARGTVEASARAVWLLDDQLDGRRRVARAMTERLAALQHEEWFNGTIGRTTGASQRRDTIERSAAQLGFVVTKSNRRTYIGQDPFPGATRAITLLFADSGADVGPKIYQDLSAVAHSSLAAHIERLTLLTPGETPQSGIPVEVAVVSAVSAYERAVRTFLTSYGWALEPWRTFIRDAYARLRSILGASPTTSDIVRVRPPSS